MNPAQLLQALQRYSVSVVDKVRLDLTASQAEALEGLVSNKFMSPALVKQVLLETPFGDAATLEGMSYQQLVDGYTAHVQAALTVAGDQIVSDLQAYVDNSGQALLGNAPVSLNTLEKLASAIGNDPTFATTAATALANHAARVDNPHAVTKEQVGLGQVSNYAVALQATAEAGTANNVYMTPLRVAQAIAVQTAGNSLLLGGQTLAQILAAADASTDNKISVAIAGLIDSAPGALNTLNELAAAMGDDPNFAATVTSNLASKETPAGAQAKVDAHGNRTDNPHGTTKAQVGLSAVENLAIATQVQAQGGTINTAYMTPLRVAEAITALGGNQFLGLTAQAADSAKLGGSTLAQVIASAQAGNAATATKLLTPRAISITGDGAATGNFDGSAPLSLALTLANSGVTAGTFTKLTVNAKGLVTLGAALAAADIPALDTSKITTGTLPLSRGGTGGTDQATARTALGIGSMATRNVTISTAAPSGGVDGDVWLQYV